MSHEAPKLCRSVFRGYTKLMRSILVGILLIIGGLSGKYALVGTHSGVALAVVGGIFVLIGGARMLNQG